MLEVFDGGGLTYNKVCLELHAHFFHHVDLHIDNFIGQPEFRYAVFQYAANLMQGLKNGNLISGFSQIAGRAQTRGSRTDNSHFDAVGFSDFRYGDLSAFPFIVCSEAFQVSYGHGRFLPFNGIITTEFTLFFLGADPSANGRKGVGLFKHHSGSQKIVGLDLFDELGNVDAHRTTGNAGGIGAVNTAVGFHDGHVGRQTQVDFINIFISYIGVALRHMNTFERKPFFCFHCLANLNAPVLAAFRFQIFFYVFHLTERFLNIFHKLPFPVPGKRPNG